jgi:hypothetical protein
MTLLYPATFSSLPAIPPDLQMALLALIRLAFSPKRTAGSFRGVAEKLNNSNPLRAPEWRAFSLAVLPMTPTVAIHTIW